MGANTLRRSRDDQVSRNHPANKLRLFSVVISVSIIIHMSRTAAHTIETRSRQIFESTITNYCSDEYDQGDLLFRVTSERDYGIDGQIELFKNGVATGRMAYIQLKGTEKEIEKLRASEEVSCPGVSESNWGYCNQKTIPVVLVYCSVTSGVFYYTDLQPLVENTEERIKHPRTVRIPLENNSNNLTRLIGIINSYYQDNLESTNPKIVNAKNAEQFINGIADNTIIQLEPGVYDISHTKATGKAVFIPVSKGRELLIKDISNLTIKGNSSKIITEFSYATVITLHNCHGIELSDICLGHYPIQGYCCGNVLNLFECSDVTLNGVELFGCGCIGLNSSFTDKILLKNCHIHSCSDCAISMAGSSIESCNLEISNCHHSLSLFWLDHSKLLLTNGFIHSNSTDNYLITAEYSSVVFKDVIMSNNNSMGVCVEDIVAPESYIECDEEEGLAEFQKRIGL